MKKKYLILLICSFMAQTILGATFYVSKTGSDTNSGTITSPFATFVKAVSVMNAGDTCIIRGGEYEEELVVDKNGTVDNYLTFKAAAGEDVKIKATSVINGWSLHSGNIYKTTVNMTIASRFRAVYHNNKYMDLARWPNNTDNNRWTIDCTPVTKGSSGSHFLADGIPAIDWTGGYVYYLGAHCGTSWTRTITSSSSGRINYEEVDLTKWPFSMHNPTLNYYKVPGNNFGQLFLFNKLEALDAAREWYFDQVTNTLYLQTETGEIPANNSVEYAARKYVATLKGNYIKLEGINFFGGSIKIFNNADNNQILNCKIVHGSEGHDNLLNDSAQVGEAAIEVLGDNTLVKGCEIDHSSANGIYIPKWAAPNCVVEGNIISNVDYLGIHATSVRTNSTGIKVIKNKIFNTGRDGMYVAGINSEIAYNDVSASQKINSDSGIFYAVGDTSFKNTEIHHNWFHDAKAPAYSHLSTKPAKAAGIYLDNDSKGYIVHHNVVWNVSWDGIEVNWNNRGLNFYHNTIWNAYNAMDSWLHGVGRGAEKVYNVQFDNRVYNNYASKGNWLNVRRVERKDSSGNPIDITEEEFDIKDSPIFAASPFVNASGQNFMPKAGSPLVDKAPAIAGFIKSFEGTSADIGAYERGGIAWTAGLNAVEDKKVVFTPTISIISKPTSIDFDDASNPSKVISEDQFKLRIDGLDATKKYNLFSRLNNQNSSVVAAAFNKLEITGVTSMFVDVNWLNFPNNPLTTESTDKFEWDSKMYAPGFGLQDEITISDILYSGTLSSDVFHKNDKFYISPNPTTGFINISGLEGEDVSYSIINTSGREIRSSANFEGLPNGVYLLRIKTSKGVHIEKIIKI